MKKLYPASSPASTLFSCILLAFLIVAGFIPAFGQAPVAGTSFALKTIETNIDPRGAAITPDGSKAIIAEWERARVRIIDLSNNTHVFANAQFAPNDVTVDQQGRYAYVTNFNSNSISRIDLTDNSSIPDFVTGIASVGNIREIRITPDGNTAIISTNQQWSDVSNFIVFVDLVNRTIISRLAIPSGANLLAMNATGNFVYTVGIMGETGIVTKVDVSTRTIVTSFATTTASNRVKGLVLSGDGNTLYAVYNNGYVSAFGSLGNATPVQLWSELLSVANLNTDYFTNACIIEPGSNRLYIVTHNTSGNSDKLLTIDLIGRTRLYTTSAGTWPNSIGISGNGRKMILSLRRFNDARIYTVAAFPGSGTSTDPYQVSNWSQLSSVRDNLSAHYRLMNNLDANTSGYATFASATSNGSAGWNPIGNASTPFNGSFDGNGFTIEGLTINRSSTSGVGLFGGLGSSSVVFNLKMQSASVTGQNNVGILAGSFTGTVRDCNVNGTVSGQSKVGALAGESNGILLRAFSKGTVTATSSYAGGMIGSVNGGTVTDAYSHATVNGTSYVGGFAGSLAGTILRSYSAGAVSGTSIVGGYAGVSTAGITSVYWDATSSGTTTSAAGISKTSTEIKDFSLFFDNGWDLQCERQNGNSDVWGISPSFNNGYPFLSAQSGVTSCPEWHAQNDNDFENNGNWKNGFRPARGMDIVVSGTASNDLELPEHWIAGNVVFNGAGRKIKLNNNHLVILGNISNANAQNFIQTNGTGKVKKFLVNGASFTFPVGRSAYNPVTITNNSGAADSLFVNVLDEVLMKGTSGNPVTGAFVNRTWDISKLNANAGAGLSFVFNWNSSDVNSPMASPSLHHYENNAWVRQTGTTSFTSNSLTYTNYTGTFSPFAIADVAAALAVALKNISATCDNGDVIIKWNTASPKSSITFYVEKSSDLQNWTVVSTVNSGNKTSFSVRDNNANGALYYRVRQRDENGKETLSAITKMNCGMDEPVSVAPIPAKSFITIKGITGAESYTVFNLQGQPLLYGNINTGMPGINVSSLNDGVYYIQVKNRLRKTTQKFVVKK